MDFNILFAVIVSVIISSANSRIHEGLQKRDKHEVYPNEECIQLERPASNYSELYEFGQTFAELVKGLESIASNFSGDVIMFVGNTGVGKSTLVHLLAGDTGRFVAAEDGEDSQNFYIVDTSGKDVTNITTKSTTTYPKAVADAESSVVFFDTPGFRDTRSSIHEVIATYGLRRVVQLSRRVKFAMLVNYDSLTTSGSRDDFTNVLQSFFSLLKNPHKYIDSTYLVATKVENRYITRKIPLVLVSDKTVINSIVSFLKSVEGSLKNRETEQKNAYNKQFLTDARSFITNLADDSSSRIALFRKPDQSGPILDSITIRTSLASIRKTLLDTHGYINVDLKDFGFTLSDTAKIYIRNLFDLMNSYVIDVSKQFTMSFEQFLVKKYKNFVDIGAIRDSLLSTKRDVAVLIRSANASQYPNEFADALWRFVDDVGANTCSNDTLKEIKQFNDFLSNLKIVTYKNLYAPSEWADSLYDIEHIVKNEQDYYVMLNSLFDKLTDYTALNDDFYVQVDAVIRKHDKNTLLINKHSYEELMKHLGLNQFATLKMNQDWLNEINTVYIKAKEQVMNKRFYCINNTLVILGSFLQLQTLDRNKMASCKENFTTVALLATNKLYVDTNIGVDVLGGRNLVVIAPEWKVMGKFVISVDGVSGGAAKDKAPTGIVGNDGKPGQSAGTFIGIALRYFNSEQLTITANGGDGQNGQAGGDGNHGEDGHDGSTKVKVDESKSIHIIYSINKVTSIIKADQGSKGGDAGMGGVGGAGGWNGTIVMHSLTSQSDRSTHVMLNGAEGKRGGNGKPGQGGLRGCDAIIKDIDRRILLFIPIGSSQEHEMLQCERRNSHGNLVPNSGQFSEAPKAVPNPPPVCGLFKRMSGLFETMDDIFTHKIIEEFQTAFNKKFHCIF